MGRWMRPIAVAATALCLAVAGLGGAPSPGVAAAIGGPFELVDHTGRTVTEADYADKHLLVYFGYASCPDICPTELLVMGQAMDELGDLADKVQPLFITVDPGRDTVEVMAAYVPAFHPRLVGLTGSTAQVKAAAKAYRVYFRLGEADENGDYLVDHTGYVYLIDPAGEYVTHFTFGQGPEKMAEIIAKHVE